MNIYSTIKALYAVMCEAQVNPSPEMKPLLRIISDDDVNKSLQELSWMMNELAIMDENIRGMYILHYTTGTDKENKNVLLQTECVFGSQTIKFTTQFDEKAAQSLIEAFQMSLAMVKAGDRLSTEGGTA